MPSTWTRLRGAVDPVARRFNKYTAYALSEREYVANLDLPVWGAREWLRSNDYEPQFLSAAKRHPETGALHDLSYRRVPTVHPPAVEGTALGEWAARDCQYHVHLFDRGSNHGADLFSHYELRPDPWPFRPRRLRTHYRPTVGETYLRGVTDLNP